MKKSDVTIIVPIYNVEKYIEKCLSSLLNQTYKNIDILAVDDGSPDNSKEIVKKFAKDDSRVKLIEKTNGGYGSVLKYSISHINTKYFLICDPDDWLANNAIEELHNLAERDNLDIVVADRTNVYGSTHEKIYVKIAPQQLNIKPYTVYTSVPEIQKFSFCQPSPHAKLYKTSLAKKIDFPTKVSYTDFVLYILSLANAQRIEYLPKSLAFYYFDRPGNTATDYRPTIVNDYLIIWNSIIKQLKELKRKDLNVLYFRMYEQLKYTLYKYALSSKNPFRDKFTLSIYQALNSLSDLNFKIPKNFSLSLEKKFVFYGFMNKHTNKLFAKFLVRSKK